MTNPKPKPTTRAKTSKHRLVKAVEEAAAIARGEKKPARVHLVRVDLPKSLHRRAAMVAAREGVSLEDFVTAAMAEGVGRQSVKPARQAAKSKAKTSKRFVLRVTVETWDPHTRGEARNMTRNAINDAAALTETRIKSARVTNADIP